MNDASEATNPKENWRECPHCGLVTTLRARLPGLAADCPRCGHTLWRAPDTTSLRYPSACGLAAAFFYAFALIAPFLEITAYGRFSLAGLATGPAQLAGQGFELVAVLVLAVTILLPGVKLGILLFTLYGLRTRLVPKPLLRLAFRWYAPLSPWAMIDVYLLGFLVAYTRLSAIAEVHLDTALFSLIGFMLAMAAADAALDPEAIWHALDEPDDDPAAAPAQTHPHGQLLGCDVCSLLNQAEEGDTCRRCHAVLRHRKPESITRAWAFMLSALLFYIPANIYPVMLFIQLGRAQNFTIMGGIAELVDYGLWPLALLVFFASITIPLMKLLILGYMLIQTHRGSAEHLLGRTRAYRLIDFIGRWSMIDVFMISILVALVRFGQFANVQAELGAPCFAAVVVLTILAANSFDPRLMWDAAPPVETAEVQPA